MCPRKKGGYPFYSLTNRKILNYRKDTKNWQFGLAETLISAPIKLRHRGSMGVDNLGKRVSRKEATENNGVRTL